MTDNHGAEAMQQEAAAHAAPVLTLHSELEEKQTMEKAVEMLKEIEAPQAPDPKAAVEALDSSLTDEEKIQVAAFSKTIDLTNPDHVMMYGA